MSRLLGWKSLLVNWLVSEEERGRRAAVVQWRGGTARGTGSEAVQGVA